MKDNRAPLDHPQHNSSMLMFADTPAATQSNWSTVRSALVAEVLRRQDRQRIRLQVYGESMLPALWPGDVVEIEGCSLGELRPGEVVLAQRDDRFFLHRLVADPGPKGFVLRGDCVRSPDPAYPADALLGRLVIGACDPQHVPDGGHRTGLSAERLGATWSRGVGILFSYCGPARRVALKLHSRRMRVRDLSIREHNNGVATIELNSSEISSSKAGAF
jgi:hypothetical protein